MMMQRYFGALLLCLLVLPVAAATEQARQYTFAWPFLPDDDMRPRGGTTEGPPLTLAQEPDEIRQAIQAPDIDKPERDRRAILAMAGGYRTSFDFIETAGFTPEYSPARPYQSWATEYIYVVEDRDDFISLQHVLVMVVKMNDGSLSEPFVVKHWRQDWRYENRDLHVYRGEDTWERLRLTRRDVAGKWSQTVYQVDDSPRYASIGAWIHHGNHSSWESRQTWRPLPRREFSVRSDYDVLVGTNRHTITPTGWVHEEDNLKVVLDSNGEYAATDPVLAREVGVNRYERVIDYDFSAGHAWWDRTGPFWADVREAWRQIFADHERFTLKAEVGGERLFEAMFGYANGIERGDGYDRKAGRRFIDETLAAFIQPK